MKQRSHKNNTMEGNHVLKVVDSVTEEFFYQLANSAGPDDLQHSKASPMIWVCSVCQ